MIRQNVSRSFLWSMLGIAVCLSASRPGSQAAEFPLIRCDPAPVPFFQGSVPRSAAMVDDAELHAVCCVGSDCWSVGDRGVILRSQDAGMTWDSAMLPFPAQLRSVCFLTDRFGFAAGFRFDPSTGRSRAVLLKTRDGGETWQNPAAEADISSGDASGDTAAADLPGIRFLQFFDSRHGVAVVIPDSPVVQTLPAPEDTRTEEQQAGNLMITEDGGRTWRRARQRDSEMWATGAFCSPHEGVLLGRGFAVGTAVGDSVITQRSSVRGLRTGCAASLTADGRGWIAGHGGLLLSSRDTGITWQPAATDVPREFLDQLDLRAVTHNGPVVCAVGLPGTCVLRSADDGRTWSARPVAGGRCFNAVTTTSEGTVLAVGAFGQIARSTDNGLNWHLVRNTTARAAVLFADPAESSASLMTAAALSGAYGYRSVRLRVTRPLPAAVATAAENPDEYHAALTDHVGADVAASEWKFPLGQPLLDQHSERLAEYWNDALDGDLQSELPLRLARMMRIWRPDVVVLDSGGPDDACSRLIQAALPAALRLSANDDPAGNVLTRVGLPPHRPVRLLLRRHPPDSSGVAVGRSDLLHPLGTTVGLITGAVSGMLPDGRTRSTAGGGIRLFHSSDNGEFLVSYSELKVAEGELLQVPAGAAHPAAGIPGIDGPETRRRLSVWQLPDAAELQEVIAAAASEQAAHRLQSRMPNGAAALIAHVRTTAASLPPTLALRQLTELARFHAASGNFDGMLAVMQETAVRFAGTPEAAEAAEQLFFLYSSEELRTVRLADQRSDDVVDGESVAGDRRDILRDASEGVVRGEALGPGVRVRQASGTQLGTAITRDSAAVRQRWDAQAETALSLLTKSLVTLQSANDPFSGESPTSGDASSAVSVDVISSDDRRTRSGSRHSASGRESSDPYHLLRASPRVLLRIAADARRRQPLQVPHRELSAALEAAESTGDTVRAALARAEMSALWDPAESDVAAVHVRRIDQRPWLDGLLSDECWQDADEILLADPDSAMSGVPGGSGAQAAVSVAWDTEFLFVAGRIPRPAGQVRRDDRWEVRESDADLQLRDRIRFSFDTDRDYETAFRFAVDESGRTNDDCCGMTQWNPRWAVATESDDGTWRFEAAIPVKELQAAPMKAGTVWVMRLSRLIPGLLQQYPVTAHGEPNAASDYVMLRFIRSR